MRPCFDLSKQGALCLFGTWWGLAAGFPSDAAVARCPPLALATSHPPSSSKLPSTFHAEFFKEDVPDNGHSRPAACHFFCACSSKTELSSFPTACPHHHTPSHLVRSWLPAPAAPPLHSRAPPVRSSHRRPRVSLQHSLSSPTRPFIPGDSIQHKKKILPDDKHAISETHSTASDRVRGTHKKATHHPAKTNPEEKRRACVTARRAGCEDS